MAHCIGDLNRMPRNGVLSGSALFAWMKAVYRDRNYWNYNVICFPFLLPLTFKLYNGPSNQYCIELDGCVHYSVINSSSKVLSECLIRLDMAYAQELWWPCDDKTLF